MADVLVIGVGNDLRRDDGVGRIVAERVADMGIPDVEVRSVSQLVPELVEEIASVDLVIVIDADITATTVTVRSASADSGDIVTTHHGSPESLVSLARTIGLDVPDVIVIGVPAQDLGLGEGLSETTDRLVPGVFELVLGLCRRTPHILIPRGSIVR